MALTYLAYLLFAFLGTFSLILFFRIHLSKKIKPILLSLICTAIVFSTWDILAVTQKHWSFGWEHTLGIHIITLPLEEIIFFIVIPFFGIVIWEIIQKKEKKK